METLLTLYQALLVALRQATQYNQVTTYILHEARSVRGSKRTPLQNRLLSMFKNAQSAAIWASVPVLNRSAVLTLPVSRQDISINGVLPSPEEWATLLDKIGLTPQFRSQMSDPVEVRERPLFVLPDWRVILTQLSHALDILWELFDKEARKDNRFYEKQYNRRRTTWQEERIAEYFARIFPSTCVYRNLLYPDPDNSGGQTELDVGVLWGPFLVLAEAKAKQFRIASQLGDIARLSSDLAANVQEAFEQGCRALRYIDSVDAPVFTEKATGRQLIINKSDVSRTYLITVSLYEFAGLTTRLASLSDLNLFRNGEYPLAISVPDLDMVSQFCEGPDVFLHYVERRLDIQKNEQHVAGFEELDLFGTYLDTRLQPDCLWKQDERRIDRVQLDGSTHRFDEWIRYQRGELDKPPEITIKLPIEIRQVLSELRARDDDGAKWIAFALLDLPDELLDSVVDYLRHIREKPPEPGRFLRYAEQRGNVVISFVATVDVAPPVLCARTRERALMEKYRRKALKSIGFGISLQYPERSFECAYWIEGPWTRDEEMDVRIEEDRPSLIIPGSRLSEKNEPCFCGSGQKFKKCCWRRIESARRNPSA